MKDFMSANQRITRLLFWHHFAILVAPIFFFLLRGFDLEETMVTCIVPLAATTVLGFFYLFDLSVAQPHCSTPSDKNMWLYFIAMMAAISTKAFAPNILPFGWMLVIILPTEIIFCRYLMKIAQGVGYVAPREIKGAKARPDPD